MAISEISKSRLTGLLLVGASVALCAGAAATPAKPVVAAVAQAPGAAASMSTQDWQARYNDRYQRNWGIDIVGVRPVSSGYMLRFAYRVLDAEKAAALLEQKSRPYLFDKVSGARLAVPAMENIGELRQTGKPAADRTYYVIFGNPGRLVKSGGRVRIVIGNFEVDDLIVD